MILTVAVFTWLDITSLYFNFKAVSDAHGVIESIFVKPVQHFSWPLVFTALPSACPLTEFLIILVPEHNWGSMH